MIFQASYVAKPWADKAISAGQAIDAFKPTARESGSQTTLKPTLRAQ